MEELSRLSLSLFQGITEEEMKTLLTCLGAERRQVVRGEQIYRTGDVITSLGIVLSGRMLIETSDLWGNTTVLDSVEPGQLFAETYACVPGEPLLVDVVAAVPGEVLFLTLNRVLQVCAKGCNAHSQFIRNLLLLLARKNLNLSRKIFYTAPKTIRERVLSYLLDQTVRWGSRSITIPFNRQQLANYLNVDRSALSNELSKLQREGLLKVERSHFTLLCGREFEG